MSQQASSPSIDAQQFSMRFRLLMSYHDLTLKDIASHTDNAVSTVGTWKNGRVPSSSDTHERLAALFGVSVNFLLYGNAVGGNIPQQDNARHVLHDIEELLGALDRETHLQEPLSHFQKALHPVEMRGDDEAPFRRSRIEGYLSKFLDRAEEQPGGLAHTWYHLRREFPLDLFSRLG